MVAYPINSIDYSNTNTLCEKVLSSAMLNTKKILQNFCNNIPNVFLLPANVKQHSATPNITQFTVDVKIRITS